MPQKEAVAAKDGTKGEESESKKGASMQDNVKKMAEASVEFCGGTADAVSSGVRAFGDSVSEGDIGRFDAKNGVIRGMFEGCARALEEAPKVVRKTYDVLAKDVDD